MVNDPQKRSDSQETLTIPELNSYKPGKGIDAGTFRDFVSSWVHRLDPTLARTRPAGELLRQIESLFSFASTRQDNEILVRVGVPSVDGFGYALNRTVVETCMADQPFILDTLRMLFEEQGLTERFLNHPIQEVVRSGGQVKSVGVVGSNLPGATKESVMHWELEPALPAEKLKALEKLAHDRLTKAARVVRDFRRMLRRISNLEGELGLAGEDLPNRSADLEEVAGLLGWLRNENFVFMSYERFMVRSGGGSIHLVSEEGSRLGLRAIEPARGIPDAAQPWLSSSDLLYVGKKALESEVHRPGKLDVILVKNLDDRGNVNQIHLISGLFTRRALSETGADIPVLRRKLDALLAEDAVVEGAFLERAMSVAFNSMPVEYLFGAEVKEIREVIRQLLKAEQLNETSVFFRTEPHGNSAFVLASIPRSGYSNELKERMSEHLRHAFGATYEDHREVFGQQDNVLVYFYLTAHGSLHTVDEAKLRAELHALARTWEESLRSQLVSAQGDEGRALANRYAEIFPSDYQVRTSPFEAAEDIRMFGTLESTGQTQFRISADKSGYVLRMYELNLTPLTISLPILSHMGFTVDSEVTFALTLPGGQKAFLNIFQVAPATQLSYSLTDREANVVEALTAAFEGRVENDRLNQLVLVADVSWRHADMLRAYIHYNRQLSSQAPLDFSRGVCLTHADASRLLIQLFEARFNPAQGGSAEARQANVDELREAFLDRLRRVEISSEDKVLRNLFTLIEGTVRTNFYQNRPYLSFKFLPSRLDQMIDPKPFREIYVHHPEVEGVHLRGGPIARGGLRWSDRYDDYRKEVLGLMTTQQVKNVVIVPVGSKGGFILKKRYTDRKFERQEADRLYKTFISGLLDVTDNIVDGKVVPPENVVRWDSDDPYLVVAADKGTAHLSDTANKLSVAKNHWLGDAFASGGSNGYDHKALSITSRGAWESVKRHFLEMGSHPERDVITCVGIGDMSGDVFGNGLLRSRTIKLLGAFNHMHVFVDPNPDPEASFVERERIFNLGPSTWEDYRPEAISKGGGVFKRTAKAIPLSPEMKTLLGLDVEALSGEELIHQLLKLKVDLMWNGGIGTYFKATHETHIDVGDRVNDAVRVDATEMGAKVVGEGGNLGFTMAARLEYAALGGKVNTDALDNSGGVDTSDHEVNLKILFEPLCRKGVMTYEARNTLLASMSDEVCDLVLYDNYSQNLVLSMDERRSRQNMQAFVRLAEFLEKEVAFDRRFEGVAAGSELLERAARGRGLFRPELCKLLAYTKMYVYNKLMADPQVKGSRVDEALRAYFPKAVIEGYSQYLPEHPLRKEIAATYMTNRIIDQAGMTFYYNIWEDASYDVTQTTFGYLLVNELLDAARLKAELRGLEGSIGLEGIYQALIQIEDLLALLTRRVIRRSFDVFNPSSVREKLSSDFKALRGALPSVLPAESRAECEKRREAFIQAGLPTHLADEVAWFPELASGADIALLKTESGIDLAACAWLYHRVGVELGLRRALERASAQGAAGNDWWNKSAMSLLRAKLVDLQYQVSLQLARRANAAQGVEGLSAQLDAFKRERAPLLERVQAFERRLATAPSQGVAPMVILSSMLDELAQA